MKDASFIRELFYETFSEPGIENDQPVFATVEAKITLEDLFVKHNVCWFGHYTNRFLRNIFCLSQAKNVFKNINKQNVLVKQCLLCVAKRASMFDEQSSKCLANNACPFRRGFIVEMFRPKPPVVSTTVLHSCPHKKYPQIHLFSHDERHI